MAKTRSTALTTFLSVTFSVALLIFLSSVIITFSLPEQFASTARIKIENDSVDAPAPGTYAPPYTAIESEVIRSERILDPVIDSLNLNEVWTKKYNATSKYKSAQSRQVLKQMLDVRPIGNTSLMDIRVFSDDPTEAANIANAVAKSYENYRREQFRLLHPYHPGQIVDPVTMIIEHAEPNHRPVRPNKPLNLFVGAFLAGAIGLVTGVLSGVVVNYFQKRSGATMPPPIQPMNAAH